MIQDVKRDQILFFGINRKIYTIYLLRVGVIRRKGTCEADYLETNEHVRHELVRRAELIDPALNRCIPRFLQKGPKMNNKLTKIY